MPLVIAFLLSLAVLMAGAVGLRSQRFVTIGNCFHERIRNGDLDVNIPVVSDRQHGGRFNRMWPLRERDFIRDTFGSY
jgi:hypothetical protein